MQDNFDVLYKCFASFQLIVEIIHWTRDFFALKCKLPIYLVITWHTSRAKNFKRMSKQRNKFSSIVSEGHLQGLWLVACNLACISPHPPPCLSSTTSLSWGNYWGVFTTKSWLSTIHVRHIQWIRFLMYILRFCRRITQIKTMKNKVLRSWDFLRLGPIKTALIILQAVTWRHNQNAPRYVLLSNRPQQLQRSRKPYRQRRFLASPGKRVRGGTTSFAKSELFLATQRMLYQV